MSREHLITERAHTPFGPMYIHIEYDDAGRLTGGHISHPRKNPDSQIDAMIEQLSVAMHTALKNTLKVD